MPVCDPDEAVEPWTLQRLRDSELLHPTPDRRDWRRWLQRTGLGEEVSLKGGQVFDTLELGIVAAARGYGVSIGDLVMVAEDVAQGRIGLPWPVAVASGESYHLVWPRAAGDRNASSDCATSSSRRWRRCVCPSSSGWRDAAGQLLALTRRYRSLPSLGRAQGLR